MAYPIVYPKDEATVSKRRGLPVRKAQAVVKHRIQCRPTRGGTPQGAMAGRVVSGGDGDHTERDEYACDDKTYRHEITSRDLTESLYSEYFGVEGLPKTRRTA